MIAIDDKFKIVNFDGRSMSEVLSPISDISCQAELDRFWEALVTATMERFGKTREDAESWAGQHWAYYKGDFMHCL